MTPEDRAAIALLAQEERKTDRYATWKVIWERAKARFEREKTR